MFYLDLTDHGLKVPNLPFLFEFSTLKGNTAENLAALTWLE